MIGWTHAVRDSDNCILWTDRQIWFLETFSNHWTIGYIWLNFTANIISWERTSVKKIRTGAKQSHLTINRIRTDKKQSLFLKQQNKQRVYLGWFKQQKFSYIIKPPLNILRYTFYRFYWDTNPFFNSRCWVVENQLGRWSLK